MLLLIYNCVRLKLTSRTNQMKKFIITLIASLVFTSSYALNPLTSALHKKAPHQPSKIKRHPSARSTDNANFYGEWRGTCKNGTDEGDVLLININANRILLGFENEDEDDDEIDASEKKTFIPIDTLKTEAESSEWGNYIEHTKVFWSENASQLIFLLTSIYDSPFNDHSNETPSTHMVKINFHLEGSKLIGNVHSILFQNIEQEPEGELETGTCTFNRVDKKMS